jgi:FkbM family methyltransferase
MDIVSVHHFLAELTGRHRVGVDYESILEQQYRRFLKADATIIDVGAHAGRHTRVFLEIAARGRVIAVEPLPDKAEALRQAFGAQITLFEGALGESEGRTTFVWAQGTPEESGLKRRNYNDPAQANPTEIEVEIRTLDGLGRDLLRCDFIKIDVEGAELTALKGGTDLLRRLRPVVSVEFGRPAYSVYGHEASELYDFAAGQGYRLHDLFLNPVPDRETWLKVCDCATWDYFMLPQEVSVEALLAPPPPEPPRRGFWGRIIGR